MTPEDSYDIMNYLIVGIYPISISGPVRLFLDENLKIKNLIPNVYKRNITCKIDLNKLRKLVNLEELFLSSQEENDLARFLFKAFPKENRHLLENKNEQK